VGTGSNLTAIAFSVVIALITLASVFAYGRYAKAKIGKRVAEFRVDEERQASVEAQQPAPPPPTPPPPAAASSVNLDKLMKVDPGFSDREFLAIARETFLLVNEARMRGIPIIARNLLLPGLEATLPVVPTSTPGLEIAGATINQFKVTGDETVLTVSFAILGYEAQSDQGKVDLPEPKRWSEDWTFVRSATTSTASDDPTSLLPGWMVAHKGWRVSAIRANAQSD
jgi:predicted lipid-binding transport protein (Tim44 family)